MSDFSIASRDRKMKRRNSFHYFSVLYFSFLLAGLISLPLHAVELPRTAGTLIEQACLDCHDGASAEGMLDLTSLRSPAERENLESRAAKVAN